MITPTFFSWDDLEGYTTGPIALLNKQVVWAASGEFNPNLVLYPRDDFESYPNGPISSLTGGTDWAAPGTFTNP